MRGCVPPVLRLRPRRRRRLHLLLHHNITFTFTPVWRWWRRRRLIEATLEEEAPSPSQALDYSPNTLTPPEAKTHYLTLLPLERYTQPP